MMPEDDLTMTIMCLAVVNVIVNLLVDIVYTLLDPRIKY